MSQLMGTGLTPSINGVAGQNMMSLGLQWSGGGIIASATQFDLPVEGQGVIASRLQFVTPTRFSQYEQFAEAAKSATPKSTPEQKRESEVSNQAETPKLKRQLTVHNLPWLSAAIGTESSWFAEQETLNVLSDIGEELVPNEALSEFDSGITPSLLPAKPTLAQQLQRELRL